MRNLYLLLFFLVCFIKVHAQTIAPSAPSADNGISSVVPSAAEDLKKEIQQQHPNWKDWEVEEYFQYKQRRDAQRKTSAAKIAKRQESMQSTSDANKTNDGGAACNSAKSNPITLPYTKNGESTNAMGNDYYLGNINLKNAGCLAPYSLYIGTLNGPDKFYYFVAPTSGQIEVRLFNNTAFYSTIAAYTGCPDPNCQGSQCDPCVGAACATSGQSSITFTYNAVAGQEYYVMVDGSGSSFNYSISVKYITQPCLSGKTTAITIPYNKTGETTCGANNSYDPAVIPNCMDFYSISDPYAGQEKIYSFTASTTGNIDVTLSNQNTSSSKASMTVFKDCPYNSCVAAACAYDGRSNISLIISAVAGQTYYLIVDNGGSNNCINYNLSLSYITNSSCDNANFESGNFNSWYGMVGMNQGCCPNGGFNNSQFYNTYGLNTTSMTYYDYDSSNVGIKTENAKHAIFSNGTDPIGGFPRVYSPGSYSARLGNSGYNANAERLVRPFIVNSSNTMLQVNFAVVFQAPDHAAGDNPYFQIKVVDETGNIINCSNYYVEAKGSPGLGWSTTTYGGDNVYYLPWTTMVVDLTGYVGQTVTAIFETADCQMGGHFGYAYLDLGCASFAINSSTGGATCQGTSMTLTAPLGAKTYSWTPGNQTTQSININSANTYCCKLGFFNGCTVNVCYTPTFTPLPTPSITGSSTICSSTSVVLTATGASSYTWSPVTGLNTSTGSTVTASPSSTTTYTITGSSSGTNACTAKVTYVVNVNPTPNLIVTPLSATACQGLNTIINASGANTYLWSPATGLSATTGNSVIASPTVTTTYTVTGNSNLNCSKTQSVVLTINPVPILAVNASGTNNINCYGQTTGTASISATGPSAPYTYVWSPSGGTASTAVNLSSGTYSVTVTDSKGCTQRTSVTLTQPASALNMVSSTINSNCGTSNGSASVTASGGTAPYTYLWNTPAGTTSTASNLSNIKAGSYTVTVTDAKGCTIRQIPVVNNNSAPVVNVSSATNILCNGGNNGALTITIGGGTKPYTYQWSVVGGSGTTNGSTLTATNLTAQPYSLVVTDANGCIASANTSLTEPDAVLGVVASTDALCNSGSTGTATVTATGGTGAYTYTWSPLGGNSSIVNNLPAGSYSVTIRDANGCTGTQLASISQPNSLVTTLSFNNPVSCFGGSDGSASISASGGTGNYTYVWAPFGGSADLVANLTQGSYTVTVTDGNGCTNKSVIDISQPSLLAITTATTAALCNGESNGVASATVTGGTAPYSYLWDNGIVSSINSVLGKGTYSLAVTDNNGCTQNTVVNIVEPDTLVPAISITIPIACYDQASGVAIVTTAGGVSPYTYLWAPIGSTGSVVSNLSSGNYSVSVTDANGCSAKTSIVVTEPTELSLKMYSSNSSCNGSTGSAGATVSGGTPAYIYKWSNGGADSAIHNVKAGNYLLTVTDVKGCTSSAIISVNNFSAPTVGAVPGTVTDASCFGSGSGSVTVTVDGGSKPYKYIWINGASKDSVITSDTSFVIPNLKSGTYIINVIDSNSCQNTVNPAVKIGEPKLLVVSVPADSIISVKCKGMSSGKITLSVSGGVSDYNYLWSNGATTSGINNIPIGTYSVVVTDSKNCTSTETVTITEPSTSLSVSISSQTDVLCNGGTGCATITAQGGTPVYDYHWSNGSSGSSVCGLTAGTYSVVVNDANSCSVIQQVTITQPAASLSAGVSSIKHVTCNGGSDGCLTITVNGGTPVYTYNWTNGSSGSTLCNVAPGNYSLTVIDAHSCSVAVTSNVTITEPVKVTVTIASNTNASICAGSTSQLTANGVSGLVYTWSTGGTTSVISVSPLVNQQYSVTATDANGCFGTNSILITVKPIPTLNVDSVKNELAKCGGKTGGIKDIIVTGGTNPLDYLWYDSTGKVVGTEKDLINVGPGTYSVVVTDANGCKAPTTPSFSVSSTPAIVASFTASPLSGEAPLKVFFTDGSKGNIVSYDWNFSNDSSSTLKNPSTTFITKDDFVVTLIVKDNYGCSSIASQTIHVDMTTEICDPPNVFTPNGDGSNDQFKPCGRNFKSVQCDIFNRWGQNIFSWQGVNGAWDGFATGGQPAVDGTYYFVMLIIAQDGRTYQQTGYVQLIR